MADFAQWGCAIAEAFGFTREEFIRVYEAKIVEQSEEALETSTEATALLRFMDGVEESTWLGEPARLLAELKSTVGSNDAEFAHGEALPKRASQLMKKLNVLKPNLRAAGLELFSVKVGGRRQVAIRKKSPHSVQVVPTAPLTQQEEADPQNSKDVVDDVDDEIPF
mgnify:FL=1